MPARKKTTEPEIIEVPISAEIPTVQSNSSSWLQSLDTRSVGFGAIAVAILAVTAAASFIAGINVGARISEHNMHRMDRMVAQYGMMGDMMGNDVRMNQQLMPGFYISTEPAQPNPSGVVQGDISLAHGYVAVPANGNGQNG